MAPETQASKRGACCARGRLRAHPVGMSGSASSGERWTGAGVPLPSPAAPTRRCPLSSSRPRRRPSAPAAPPSAASPGLCGGREATWEAGSSSEPRVPGRRTPLALSGPSGHRGVCSFLGGRDPGNGDLVVLGLCRARSAPGPAWPRGEGRGAQGEGGRAGGREPCSGRCWGPETPAGPSGKGVGAGRPERRPRKSLQEPQGLASAQRGSCRCWSAPCSLSGTLRCPGRDGRHLGSSQGSSPQTQEPPFLRAWQGPRRWGGSEWSPGSLGPWVQA